MHARVLWLRFYVVVLCLAGASSAMAGSQGDLDFGATVEADGVGFKVWAPGAKAVAVAGDFNAWSPNATPLREDGNGNFLGFAPGAKAGQRYEYVVTSANGTILRRADPRAAQVENSVGHAIIVDSNSYNWQNTFQMPGWDDLVIYEVHVGTFGGLHEDADGNHPSTFNEVAARLPALHDLGINMIELMPVAEFPGDFSWGYNPSFPFAPESAYGTPDDLKALVDQAHGQGIGVMLDVVHNHYGPNDLPMWCFSGDCLGHGGPYFYTDWRANTPWGETRPDYGRPEVRAYIRDAALHWTEEYHMDGLRWDATKYIRSMGDGSAQLDDGWRVMREANDAVHERAPWKLTVAEDMAGDGNVTQPTESGGLGFSSQWDSGFVHTLRGALVTSNDADRSMSSVAQTLGTIYNGQATQRVIYSENHDECANGHARLPEDIWPGHADSWYAKKRSTLGAVITLTAPGIPLLLQGQEHLEDRWFSDTIGVDWDKEARFAGIVTLYRDLIALRRDFAGNTRGLKGDGINVFHVNETSKVIAYHRWKDGGPGDDTIILANFSNTAFAHYKIGVPRAGLWKVRFNSDSKLYDASFGDTPAMTAGTFNEARDGLNQSIDIGIGPYSALILSQD